MAAPVLVDLFCKAGGCGVGYARAGWDVVGVDIEPQPHYPFRFVRADWREGLIALLVELGSRVVAVHASPPCQAYTTGGRVRERESRPRLIEPVREAFAELAAAGIHTVIENVDEAPLVEPVRLCGSMFGLGVRRHRLFEVSFECERPTCSTAMHRAQGPIAGVYGRPHGAGGAWPGMQPSTTESWSRAMGIDWMTAAELSQAIPPAYTEWIGRRIPTCRTPTRSGS
jgi:hypothetical protein